uniref:Spt5-NGN domain-containing protein n=1 Tax=Macrostomum lignano TaxID=282301 RepID=A0A1I8IU70_9PLAT
MAAGAPVWQMCSRRTSMYLNSSSMYLNSSSMYLNSTSVNSGGGGGGGGGGSGDDGDGSSECDGGFAVTAATDRNNSMAISEFGIGKGSYQAPKKPEPVEAYVPEELSAPAEEFRETFRPETGSFVQLWLRVRRMNYEQLLWQLISTGRFQREQTYDPENLPFWTIGMRVKVRSQLTMGRVMAAIRCRLGTNCPGLRFCLDGFFGMRGYSDIFNSADACPWMEISNFSTAISLRLQHGDNVFISIATPAQIADVIAWRRTLAMSMSKPKERQMSVKEDDSSIIGKIAYDSQVMHELLL